FAEKVIADFCAEYARGRTPNPCVRCNQFVKFGPFLERAKALGADFIATGHYARIEREGERYLLKKGIDPRKDQSYALCMLTQEQLRHSLMPLGNYTKERVRQIARDLALPVAEKAESQEICFVPDNDYRAFVRSRVPATAKPGPILDREGKTLGEHSGIINYTIGQRRGMGIAAARPLYVIAIDPERNAVIIGPQSAVYGRELTASDLNWIAIEAPSGPFRAQAKVRYLHREARAMVTPLEGGQVRVCFEEPQMAITPGQFVVFYDCDVVLGGGVIDASDVVQNRMTFTAESAEIAED
ncbi:MAG: tRNA 2-thiouridine(34) synthase MnmA, partial [Chloroflexi bacterium]|nr:tRNA 2-thiouridine(34) synthase MnmA [Chloroflexota bacterium]